MLHENNINICKRWFLFFFTSHISSFTCHWYFLNQRKYSPKCTSLFLFCHISWWMSCFYSGCC